MGTALLLPSTAMAATNSLHWSPDGSGVQPAALENLQSGCCCTLQGDTPLLCDHVTNRIMIHHRSAGCSARTLTPSTSGDITRYMRFD